MAARKIDVSKKNWYKETREPASARDHLVIVRPEQIEALKGCPKVMTVQQVAEFLVFSIDTIYRWIREYKRTNGRSGLRAQSMGRNLRIFRDDLAAYLTGSQGMQRG
jgi:excisionase family DNA binding protein